MCRFIMSSHKFDRTETRGYANKQMKMEYS